MPKQQAIITISDLDDNKVSVQSQFLPEVKGPVMSRAVGLWKKLMAEVAAEGLEPQWMTTYSGHKFTPLNPDPATICIEDIAHSLSQICRFGGHTLRPYSVAQHCIHVSKLVAPENALVALLHDAPEAYIGDMVHPLKLAIPRFRAVELGIWLAIAEKFNLPLTDPSINPDIKRADIIACMTERRDLLKPTDNKWVDEYENTPPDEQEIIPMDAWMAEAVFLNRFAELSK